MNPMNDWLGFDPMTEMSSFRDAMRQLVDAGLPVPRDMMPATVASVLVPVDILDVGSDLVVRANVPGVAPESVTITVNGNLLTLKGDVRADSEFEGATYLRRERRASTYTRSVNLPLEVDADHAHATSRDGVLIITLPKSESVRPKTIRVKTE